MATETHVRQGGVWNEIISAHTKVGGSWKDVKEIHSKVSGVWRLVFQLEIASISGATLIFRNPNDAKAGVRFLATGFKQEVTGFASANYITRDSANEWVVPKAYSKTYHLKTVVNSGDTPGPSAVGVWLEINTTRTWELVVSGEDLNSCNITISISDDGGSTTLDTAVYTLTADGLP